MIRLFAIVPIIAYIFRITMSFRSSLNVDHLESKMNKILIRIDKILSITLFIIL